MILTQEQTNLAKKKKKKTEGVEWNLKLSSVHVYSARTVKRNHKYFL